MLRVSKVGQDRLKAGDMLGSDKEGSIFSFTGAGNNTWDNCGEGMNSTADLERLVMVA
jgi:hypothetical protein